jgi:hypothetical protein
MAERGRSWSWSRRNRGGVAALLALAALQAACQTQGAPSGFSSDQTTIQMVSTNVGGKNVFIPGTVVVASGRSHTLSIFNTTDTPHGFQIAALGIREVLPSGEELQVALPPLDGGHKYQIKSHLHPPHRSATLVVVPGD